MVKFNQIYPITISPTHYPLKTCINKPTSLHSNSCPPYFSPLYLRKNEPIRLSFETPFDSELPFFSPSYRTMASHIVGYPRMGPKRELKFALESFWDGKSSAEDLQNVSADLRSSIWKQMSDVGIKYIPSNTFSYYDQVLDTTTMLGAVPPRYNWNGGEIGFDTYFSMARGNASVPAMEMTKWFDTNYHFIVPELGPDVKFSYASHKAVNEYKEAKALGVDTVPVFVGPVSYLLLSKPAKGVEKTFDLLSLLDKILPVYKEVIAELKEAGATWIQFDEATLVKDLEPHQLQAFTKAYSELESTCSGLNVLVATYFADIPADAFKTLTTLPGVTGYTFDLVRGEKTLDLIKTSFPSGKYLFAGVVDGRNIWANDLAGSLSVLESLEAIVGKDKLVVSTSSSLLHTAVDLVNETKLDDEIKSWLAFAAQKVVEVNALAKALAGHKDEAFFAANAAAQASRKCSPRVNNEAVQKAAAALRGSDHRRATNVSARLDAQQKKLNLPILPTTTIGSFPQTIELRRVRREYKAKKISEEEYVKAIKEEIFKVVQLQEELDIDVLVHGEPERNDMVEYFGEQLSGFAFTANGWVQSYGSRCVKPPIIYGDVSRPKAMTVFWSTMAQEMTKRPMKGMLTGPVTILNWSFVRNDQPRFETCYQIALAIKDEVEDLEKAGITVIQIDEAALREGLPLRKAEHAFYLDWAVHSFRITNVGVLDTTQIHTHMCYSNFNDIIHSIINMDADVITIENSRSDEKLLSVFREGVKYGAGIGPGVYDIHSPRIPSMEEIADRINKMLAVLETNILWVNPDCGLKTRKYGEVKPALENMVTAAKKLRSELASANPPPSTTIRVHHSSLLFYLRKNEPIRLSFETPFDSELPIFSPSYRSNFSSKFVLGLMILFGSARFCFTVNERNSNLLRIFKVKFSIRAMASHIVGYPRMGPKRELKFALESFWDGKSSAEDLQNVSADLRSSIWKQMSDVGIKYIPSNTFSYYDQVLDTTTMLGAVPPRYNWNGGEIGFDTYFSMARGNASVPAMEMTKWFDTNYHFIVPELGPDVKFSYASHKAVNEYKEAKALGVDTVPVFVGPVSYLLLSKPAKGVEKTFDLLSLLDKILPVYKEVIAELKEAGATWIQFDEATLVKDLEPHQLQAFTKAYSELESTCSVIQIDEAALREGLPLRKAEHAFYLDWAVHSFRITNVGVLDTTQIHTHMCYSNFNDIIHSIINMDADVITIENSRSDEKLLSVFREGVKYGAGIGPGVYDIHSPRIPSMEEIADRVNKMLAVLETNILWVNPDCGLKTRKYGEVKPALENMVTAAKKLRSELASAK
ncbi:Cobalamin-independent methionine synthase [Cynara cardunculus var. scolymus]|uniref:5-methyltetrahydropteroyltriglutamate--homocysteine S-methyltransferase n=1 Tax=Cynara cardunculus var. scolymus TaxID=59895 RepID=A0A103XGY2_CYNCS|nr:Cobalamin-independent methionine synthase [Cynara cardunculus var. scolymus]